MNYVSEVVGGMISVFAVVVLAGAYITHIVWWIGLMANANMEVWQGVLAIMGVVAPPIGVIHGIILWLG